jgi:predicted GNAT family acetyltransferase
MTTPIFNNESLHRYEYRVGDQTVFADYRREGGILSILHVEAPPALRGTGAAGALMQGLVNEARDQGFKLRPVCGYAAAWLEKHKEYGDLIA